MTAEQRGTAGERTLLDLLGKGDIAGLEKALGLDPGEFERIMTDDRDLDDDLADDDDPDDDCDDCDDCDECGDWADCDDEEDDDWLPRPHWLHPDCRSVCSALDLGTCCEYPDNPLVRVAADLAGSADRAVGRLSGGGCEANCGPAGAELANCFRMIPGLLAQIHAVLPRLSRTARAQLLCPVGTLASALDQACGDGCPWGCDDPAVPDRRGDFRAMIELVAECSTAIRSALGGPAQSPVAVRPRRPRG